MMEEDLLLVNLIFNQFAVRALILVAYYDVGMIL